MIPNTMKILNNETNELIKASKDFSKNCQKLSNWNGHSARGTAIYDRIFEAEKAMDDAIFCESDPGSEFWDGSW